MSFDRISPSAAARTQQPASGGPTGRAQAHLRGSGRALTALLARLSGLPLFWRVFAINAALLVGAALIVAVPHISVAGHRALGEAIVLTVGLVAVLFANLLLLRPSFGPLEQLAERMRSVDLLQPDERLALRATGEVGDLVRAYNEMLERLEAERAASGRRALAAQEAERARVARGLHDEVGQRMTGVLLQLKRVASAVPEPERAEITLAQQEVREALDEVRRIAQELRPELLEHLGLVSALRALANTFSERAGWTLRARFADELPPLSDEAELAIYRIAQESLTNVARHADARTLWLELDREPDAVLMRIADDGAGFRDEGEVRTGGLRGMRERALMVGATLTVRPLNPHGVEVRLAVPCDRQPS